MLHVDTIVVGPFEVNAYLLRGDGGAAWVVDPGAEPDRLRAALDHARCRLAGILLTHGHADHTHALGALLNEGNVPVWVHPDDAAWMLSPRNSIEPYYQAPVCPAENLREVTEGQEITIAGAQARVLHTPGHTPGGVCYYFERDRMLFSGDTLFQGSVGRSDLAGGDARRLAASLRRLAALPDDIAVYPGHGPATSMAREKATNYFLQEG